MHLADAILGKTHRFELSIVHKLVPRGRDELEERWVEAWIDEEPH
jgi:hypothetical protein